MIVFPQPKALLFISGIYPIETNIFEGIQVLVSKLSQKKCTKAWILIREMLMIAIFVIWRERCARTFRDSAKIPISLLKEVAQPSQSRNH